MENLPQDCLGALHSGFQFSFWRLLRSSIGKIKLKRADQLELSKITTFPGCQSILDDPFQRFDGMYHIDIIDLIAESSAYDPEGLFCWIPSLGRFASVDHTETFSRFLPSHGRTSLGLRNVTLRLSGGSPRKEYASSHGCISHFDFEILR